MILALPPVAPITLDLRATSLTKALPEIGRAFGVPMRATPAIGDEIGIFALKAAPLEAFKARLAETFAAEWRTEPDGTLILSPDARTRAAEARASLALKRAEVARILEAYAKDAREMPPFTPADARERRKERDELAREAPGFAGAFDDAPDLPAPRLLTRLLAGFRPEDLAPSALASRTVFSTAPTRLQRAFPNSVAPPLAQFAREEAVWRDAATQSERALASADRVTLVAESDDTGLNVAVRVFDARGKLLANAEASLYWDLSPGSETPGQDPPAETFRRPTIVGDDPQVRLVLSPESLRFARAFRLDSGEGVPPGHALAGGFLDPTVRDPLSYETTDAVLAYARASGRSVIARPEDAPPYLGAAEIASDLARMETPLSALIDAHAPDARHPGWLLLRPADPYSARQGFFPRPALERALRKLHAEPRPSLETVLAAASEIPDGPPDAPLTWMLLTLAPRAGFLRPDTPKFLHALGAAGRATAEARGLRFAEMTSDARRRAERLVFGPGGRVIRLEKGADARRDEPTTFLSQGLPADAVLRIVREDAPLFLVPNADGVQSLRAFALAAYLQGRRDEDDPLGELDLTKIRVAIGTTYRLQFRLAPDAVMHDAHRTTADPLPETYTLATLPKRARAALDAEIARSKARPAEPDAPADAPPPQR